MSYTIGDLVACERIQRDLNEFFKTCPVNEYMPFFEFLNSERNRSGINMTVSPGDGKVRQVRVVYTPRPLESSVTENGSNPNCAVNNFIGNRYQDYTIDTSENVTTGFSMSAEDMAYACQGNREYFLGRLNDAIDAIDRKLATLHTADMLAFRGNWASNVTTNGFEEFVVATALTGGFYNPTAIGDIDFALQKTGFCAQTMIFAGNDLATYYRNGNAAGCCSNQGIDVEGIFNAYGRAVAYDRRVEANLGTDGAVAIQAGALQLLTYNRAPWIRGIVDTGIASMGGDVYMQIFSPRTGLPIDLMVSIDCAVVSVSLAATTKLVGMPADMFQQGDFMEGVTYVAGIDVQNP